MEAKQLSSIPETMLITLWAKATETSSYGGLIHDEVAKDIIESIDYDFSKFKGGKLSQIGCCVRAALIDNEVRSFLARYPDAVVVQLGAGLDGRYQRLGCPEVSHWFDLDLKEVIDIRRQLIPETDRNTYLELSMFDYQWIDIVKSYGKPVLILVEGVLMYFDSAQVKAFFQTVCDRFDAATLVFDMLAYFALKHTKHHDTIGKMSSSVSFLWSELDTRTMEAWHPKLHIDRELCLSDHDQGRFPLALRLMCYIPYFYKRFNQRVVKVDIWQ
uniref:Class I SAM-dependent methyltransferase n=2 Tax=unclassified Prevotella TaxID=2638335 RepID=A0AB33J2T3_9BACT